MTNAMIDGKRARQADRILQQLLDLPVSERAELLVRVCGGDDELKDFVERLLVQAMADDSRFSPGGGLKMFSVKTSDFAPQPETYLAPGKSVGVYRLIRVLGSGGMATVYLAERDDGQFEQTVALKILNRGGETLARFEQERQILASLDHPNIARLLDGGVTEDGVPYVAMEYIEGLPLLEYCNRQRLDVERRLQLFRKILDAIHDAHRKLIVHRDIKSANILVTATGKPKLLDFGIAKLLETGALPHAAPVTRMHSPMTPEYASPEQVRGEPMSVATDIYQLGYLLYVLLTDQSPYAPVPTDMVTLVDAIARCEPAAPSRRIADKPGPRKAGDGAPWAMRDTTQVRLQKRLHGDLDRVALKALHKDPDQRYGSAAEFAADIDNVLTNRPINARPDSVRYRTSKFVQRHLLAVVTASVVVLSIIVGSSIFTYRLSNAKQLAELEAAKSDQVTNFLMGLFEANDPGEALGDSISARELLDRGAEKVELLVTQPDVQAQMSDVLGQMYYKLGQYDDARQHLSRALALRREQSAGPSADVARSLASLGNVLVDAGEFADAEELFRDALGMQRLLFDDEHAEVASSLNGLGNTLYGQGDYDGAERLFREALAMRRLLLGANHPDVATSLNDLGLVLVEKDEYDEAESMHRQALAMQRNLLGGVHPDITDSLHHLALVLHAKGDYDAAEDLYREQLEMNRKLLGEEHPEVAMNINNLATLLHNNGKQQEAETLHWQALAIRRKQLPENHPHTAQSLHNLATIFSRRGDLEKAEPLYREALAMKRTLLGNEHPEVAATLQNLAVLLRDRGDYDGAESLLLEALAIKREVFGELHTSTAYSLHSLATIYDLRGNAPAAEPLHRKATASLVSTLGEQHNHTVAFQLALASNLTVLGRFEEAETVLLGVQTALVGADRNDQGRLAWQKLAELYDAWQKQDRAVYYRELAQAGERI